MDTDEKLNKIISSLTESLGAGNWQSGVKLLPVVR